jgi:hypothetical protein
MMWPQKAVGSECRKWRSCLRVVEIDFGDARANCGKLFEDSAPKVTKIELPNENPARNSRGVICKRSLMLGQVGPIG